MVIPISVAVPILVIAGLVLIGLLVRNQCHIADAERAHREAQVEEFIRTTTPPPLTPESTDAEVEDCIQAYARLYKGVPLLGYGQVRVDALEGMRRGLKRLSVNCSTCGRRMSDE